MRLRIDRAQAARLALFFLVWTACRPEARGPGRSGTVTLLYESDERVFGPYWSVEAQFLMFLPLVTYDEKGEKVGRLAHSWEHSPDYRTWTFRLRTDVRWHDGVPVTAHDVKFSLELFAHPDVLFQNAWQDVESITLPDDSTLTFRYARPKDALDDWTVYYPKHLLEGLDPKEFWRWEFWTQPVGNGPYRYVRHVPKTMVELEANPDYYRGKPQIERVVLKFGREGGLAELLSGNVDVLTWVNRADLPKLGQDPRFRVYHGLNVGWLHAIFWNHRHALFRDPTIRRALTHAIDRRELLRLLNVPDDIAFTDVLFTRRQYSRGELPEPLPYDLVRARQLLDAAGWRDSDGNGVRDRNGAEFSFTALVPAGSPLEETAVLVQSQLRRLGVAMEVQTLDRALVRNTLRAGKFQAAFEMFFMYVDSELRWLGEKSPLGYDNPRVVRRLKHVKETADPVEIDAIYRELWPILRTDLPITFLYPSVQTYVVLRRIQGLRSPHRVDPVGLMEELSVEEGG